MNIDKLLLKTAFCCMASDGHIDSSEIETIRGLCEVNLKAANLDFQSEINHLIGQINANPKVFIADYFKELERHNLSLEEEVSVIDFSLKTINADNKVEYAEIKFFKNIRHRLKIADTDILNRFPDIGYYLEEDIQTGNLLEKITGEYLETMELPQFTELKLEDLS